MSLKDLFKEDKNLKSAEPLSKNDFKDEIESFDYAAAINKRNIRFIATEDFVSPTSFARFGSAEKYYEDAITRIADSYPYDGSLREKVLWEVSSSLIDLYVFENGYPRTTGYANFLTSVASTGGDGPNGEYLPPSEDDEYILVKGGPHAGTGKDLYYDELMGEVVYRKDANVYDLSENQENNLLIDGTKGNTLEFWLKKDAYVPNIEYFEFILDAHVTGTTSGESNYGRFQVGLATTGTVGNSSNQVFGFEYSSGSVAASGYIGSTSLTTSSVADGNWHHYALRFKTSGSDTLCDLFVDGQHDDATIIAGKAVGYVSGAIVATIGAQAAPLGSSPTTGSLGWSKLSGSLDELRYWKRWRTSKQIQTRWFDQVGAGTNTDLSNTDLGVYYKFNEGITQTASIDSKVLDYSGRVSNGTWVGYNTSSSRNIGSAILESSASSIEFKDPIIYKFHPDVESYKTMMMTTGSYYDDANANSLKAYMPAWILEQNETEKDISDNDYLLNLLQVIGSYFDEAAILLNKLPELSHIKYYKGKAAPPPFNIKNLESMGFAVPEIFINADLLEAFESRDDEIKFEKSLQEVKNIIYQNIYNNLRYINKTKGTIKSLRNLLRCFGIGDNVLKINLYGEEAVYKLEDNLQLVSRKKNYINFNKIGNNDGSVYQYKIDDNSTSYISGTSATDGTFEGAGLSFTVESNVILPNRVSIAEYATVKHEYDGQVANLYPLHIDSSLFGMHTADGTENSLTWDSNDYANFQVSIVKDDKFSSNAYFKLTGSSGGFIPNLTSSIFENVYDDQLWTISVTVEPTKKDTINQIDGSATSLYTVRFYGVNHIADYKAQEFLVTGTLTNDQGRKFLSSPKRVFVGAHRTNFTGSVIDFADTKINSCKAWYNSIPTGTIDNHNLKLGNYGSKKPTQNTFLYQDSIDDRYVPEAETLALLWDFSAVTGSDASGQFSIEDETSGSANDNRYGWFSDLVSRRHTASGSFFIASSTDVVQSLERTTYQPQVPEVLLDSNLTRILSQDDEYYNRNTRPTTYHLSIEKNLFQDISEEMLNMFGSVVWFNNMIGTPVNMYRGEYKELKKAADLFFEKVDNDYDFDKYVEYFKFIDYAVSRYLVKLVPASMLTFEDGISTVIENFVLGDRNKYTSKYPITKEMKREPDGQILAINELTYNWKHGHAPLSPAAAELSDNCLWWKERSKRTLSGSGNPAVDSDRQTMLDSIINETNASAPTLYDNSTSQTYEGSTYVTRRLAKPYKIKGINQPDVHGGSNFYQNKKVGFWDALRRRPTPAGEDEGALISIEPPDSTLDSFIDCDDDTGLFDLKGKRKYSFSAGYTIDGKEDFIEVYKGDMIFPFSLYSSSLDNNPSRGHLSDFQSNLDITNLHDDNYGPFNGVPMQGPFTEKYVGGRAYRHVFTAFTRDNEYLDDQEDRLEGWILSASSEALDLKNPGTFKSTYFRDGLAKRPVNVANIQQTTGAALTDDQYIHPSFETVIGNYSETYEIAMTNGRSINNRYLVESDGFLPTTSTDSTYVSGVVDFSLPRRDLTGSNKAIIVSRFSAPGDPATMGEGMLDVAAGEYSVYNALPYRNLNVRMALQELYSDHCEQFGYFSDWFTREAYDLYNETHIRQETYPGGYSHAEAENYDGTGSFHKVNKNWRRTIQFSGATDGYADDSYVTVEKADNWFIQHLIPQTDLQYAWITASVLNNYTGSALYGYETKDTSLGDYASSDITFCSQSSFGLYNDGGDIPYDIYYGTDELDAAGNYPMFYNFDFAGLNIGLVDPITPSENTIGFDTNVDVTNYINRTVAVSVGPTDDGYRNYRTRVLNTLLLHRDGPWGGANWKLYRKDNHPIVRHQKNNNIIGSPSTPVRHPIWGNITDYDIKNFTEPPITSKYKPLKFSFKYRSEDSLTTVLTSLGNLRTHFTDHTAEAITSDEYSSVPLDILLPTGETKYTTKLFSYNPYAAFGIYLDSKNLIKNTQVVYAETIYPKGLYTYLSGSRKRLLFVNDFWRTARDDRTKNDLENSIHLTIETSSIWKLDAHPDFAQNPNEHIPFKGGMTEQDGVGELQNCYSLFHYQTASNIKAAINYNRRIKLVYPGQVTANDWRDDYHVELNELPQFSQLASASNPRLYQACVGDTLWEASSSTELDGNYKPFYDSYDEYSEEGFRNLKDGTILPEFRISEKIDDYIDANVNMQYNNYSPFGFFKAFVNNPDALKLETGLLSLTGAASTTTTEEFLNRYSFSDFYDYFQLIEEDYEDKRFSPQVPEGEKVNTTRHKLSCEAILKFLPYDGFYPAERTAQLGSLLSGSISGLDLSGDEQNMRTFLQPFYAPGILFNSIKSGIAVDYPVFSSADDLNSVDTVCWGSAISGNFDKRFKIDELITPGYNTIFDAEVDPDLRLNSTASYKLTKNPKHTFAMSNFLAETMNLFIGRTSTEQAVIRQPQYSLADTPIQIPSAGTYSMHIHLRNSRNILGYSEFAETTASMFDSRYKVGNDFMEITCSLSVNTSSVTMYNRALTNSNIDPYLYGSSFGPPVDCGDLPLYRGATTVSASNESGSAFDPFTPSYYNGFGTVKISAYLDPDEYADGAATPTEIFSTASWSYDRLRTFFYPVCKDNGTIATDVAWRNAKNTTNYRHSMQISASLFLGDENIDNIIYVREAPSNPANPNAEVETREILAIKPRWECPVLDFSRATPTESAVSGNIAQGMWHQYGLIPDPSTPSDHEGPAGLWMQMEGATTSGDGDLATLLKFVPKKELAHSVKAKVGRINAEPPDVKSNFFKLNKKEFSETIVAIPFKYIKSDVGQETELYSVDDQQTTLIKNNLYFNPANRFDAQTPYNIRTFEEIKAKLTTAILDPVNDESKSLYDLMLMMRKYVIPPHLDFLHNPDVEPFVMFMMEYSIDLSQRDLQNIWQNVEPTFARQALRVRSETNLHLMPTTLNQGTIHATAVAPGSKESAKKVPNHPYFGSVAHGADIFDAKNTRWAVFKVKKRAAANYNSVAGKLVISGEEYTRKDLKGKTNDFLYSYNWPYDFFSLIELAKINSITTFNPNYTEEE
jgi:hypothetical protein